MTPRLLEKYKNEIVSQMVEKFNFKNKMQVPKVEKVVINMGIGAGASDIKIIETAMAELAQITGQKPVITRSKKAISNFKIRKGSAVGLKVTLRKNRMYEFLDRFINVTLPRIRDFRGLPADSFDEGGNYSLGLTEQTIFPEIDVDKVQKPQGMNVTICTTAKEKEYAYELLKLFGMPFREEKWQEKR
ncbi:MAG: 50S ribosomal protein L5 [Candidatus Omnitrophota bacterium]